MDHQPLGQSGLLKPRNHPEYEPSNFKSNNSQFENLVEKKDYFGGLEPPRSPYPINVENYGDCLLYYLSMGEGIFSVPWMSENINPATL